MRSRTDDGLDRAPAPHGPPESRRARSPHAADRRRLFRHLPCRGRRAALLRQARPAEAQGRSPLGSAGRAQRGGGGLDARRRALAAARRSADPRRGREGRRVRDGLSRARGSSACGRRSFSLATSSRVLPPLSGATSPSSMRGARPTPTFGKRSPTTARSRRSASSPISARPAAPTPCSRRASRRSRARRFRPNGRWFTATSARRTSCAARSGRCSSTPNAPGSAIPPSISPSASTISCSRARATARIGRATTPRFRRWRGAYLAGVDWESADGLEARAAALLPALFLARVDGKSPVEYLTLESERAPCAAPPRR